MSKKKIVLAVLLLASLSVFATSYTVLNLNIVGNTHVASPLIEKAIMIQSGKVYDGDLLKSLLMESAQKVMNLGYFFNVTPKIKPGILPDTVNITFYVKENPIVEKVEFTGISLIKKSTAEASSLIKVGEPLNLNDLKQTLQNIFSLYQKAGYSFSVDITTNVKQNSTGLSLPNSTLKINVKEYALYDVVFEGEIVGTLQDMKKFIEFKTVKKIESEAPLFKWIDSLSETNGYVKDQDIISLRYKLMSTGYYSQVDINRTVASTSVKGYPYLYNLIINLKENKFIEGNQSIKNIKLNGVTLVNKNFLKIYLLSKASTKTSVKNVSDLINDIKKFYKDRNYLGIDVTSEYNSQSKTLTFNVYERKIRRIIYSGDVILAKNLLDKTLRFHVGQPLKLSSYVATVRNLQMTGYFKNVNVIPTPVATNDSLMDIIVQLEAKEALGNFSGGISWGLDQSKIDDIYSGTTNKWDAFWQIVLEGISADMKIQRSNLTGIGDDLSLTLVIGKVKKNISADYKINWINGSDFSPDFSVFYRNNYDLSTPEASDIKETYGIGFKTTYTLNDFNSVNAGFNIDHYKSYTLTSSGVSVIKTGIEGSLLLGYTFDGRDNPVFPRNGLKISANNETKFLDFSSFDYNKTKVSASFFWEPFLNWVLASNVSAGYIYPITNTETAFYEGGSTTVRGWGTDDFPSVSGPRMLQLNFELRYKTSNGMVLIPAFFDAAHAGGKTIASVGSGIGVVLPMLGTIQIGAVYPIADNSSLNYYVGFGGIF